MGVLIMFDKLRPRYRSASPDDVRRLFGDYRNVLTWLSMFLTRDKVLAEHSVVDACTIAEQQGELFHDWLIYWGARATVRIAYQQVHEEVTKLASEYALMAVQVEDQKPLSAEMLRVLVENSEVIASNLDVFCRFVLVLRGIAQDGFEDVARHLGSTVPATELAYSIGVASVEAFSQRSADSSTSRALSESCWFNC